MKNLLTLLMGALLSSQVVAASYPCEEVYEKNFSRFNLNSERDGRIIWGTVAGTAIVESAFFSTTLMAGSLIVMNPVAMGVFAAGLGYSAYQNDKVEAHLTAKAIIEESLSGRDAVIDKKESAYYAVKYAYADAQLKKINRRNKKRGLPEASREDYLKLYPVIPFDREGAQTPLGMMVDKINKKRGFNVDYLTVASIVRLLSQNETFCREGDAMGKRQVRKTVVEYLTNDF